MLFDFIQPFRWMVEYRNLYSGDFKRYNRLSVLFPASAQFETPIWLKRV